MHGTSPGEATLPITSFGGLVTLAVPESLPEGASPRTWNTDYLVGEVNARDGLTNVYNHQTSSVGPSGGGAATSSTWSSPASLLSSSGYASFTPASTPNSVDVTEFGFALSEDVSITGIQVQITGYANAPTLLLAELISGGVVVASKEVFWPVVAGAGLVLGSLTDRWGIPWLVDTVNAVVLAFG